MQDFELDYLATKPLCAICKKPLTRRSLCLDLSNNEDRKDFSTYRGMHIRCHNRTCLACGKRVAPKDRWTMAHRFWHQKCWVKALNFGRAQRGEPLIVWEEWIEGYRKLWEPNGAVVQILSKHFPPPPG